MDVIHIIQMECYMLITKTKRFLISISLMLGIAGFGPMHAIFPLIMAAKMAEQKKSKNLILVLDVKQQENYLGACGYILATALKDKVSPIIASAHSLYFVSSYFRPTEWNIYTQQNLVLFIPKDYLSSLGLNNATQAGFNLDEWNPRDFGDEKYLRGSELYALLAPQPTQPQCKSFADLSHDSLLIISKTLKKDHNNRWKVYVVGHGAPDACQVAGLNLVDFRTLLKEFENRTTDFFVYQTCFGGSLNQLRDVYGENQETYKKFRYPIISCSLTNSVSFGCHPDAGTSFKGLFEKVDCSLIMENRKTELLQALNELNKGLDFASHYHFSNNLLLIRMPGKEYFEPIADNRFVYNLTEFNTLTKTDNELSNNNFKCFLVNHPILDDSYDFSKYTNFMIASGISRPKHYIKEIILPAPAGKNIENCLADATEIFNSLAFPEKPKKFFVATIKIGNSCVFTNATITQKSSNNYGQFNQLISIEGFVNNIYYFGTCMYTLTSDGIQRIYSDIAPCPENEGKKYLIQYNRIVTKHLKKKHMYPLYIPSDTAIIA